MKKLTRIGLGIVIAGTLALSTVGCGKNEGNSSTTNTTDNTSTTTNNSSNQEGTSGEKQSVTVRVADMSAWQNAYFEYGEEKGLLDDFFENDKYDITFEISSFANGPAEIEAFAAGELDFASMGSMPATTGASSNFGFKIVAANGRSEAIGSLVALADSGITSIEDLKGKKVGTIFGGTLHYYTGRFLETAGLSYDDIEFINCGNETPSSLRAGEIDAGAISNSVAVDLVNEGTVVILSQSVEGVVGFSQVCISDRILNDYEGLGAILLKGFDELYRYIGENGEDYVEYLHELTGVETEGILATWDLTEKRVFSLDDEEIYRNSEELLVWMQEQDMVENTDVTLDEIVDFTVAREAGIEI